MAEFFWGEYADSRVRVVHRDPVDGAVVLSYPPPLGTSNRVEHIAYADCFQCGGRGRVAIDENTVQGCPACADRFVHHPLRHWFYRREAAISRAELTLVLDAKALLGEGHPLLTEGLRLIAGRAAFLRQMLAGMVERRKQRWLVTPTTRKNGKEPHL